MCGNVFVKGMCEVYVFVKCKYLRSVFFCDMHVFRVDMKKTLKNVYFKNLFW